VRVLALDYGEARCGVAVSDATGCLATPIGVVEQPGTRRGLASLVALAREREAERVVVGLPLTMAGTEGPQAAHTRAFAERLAEAAGMPVDLYDERLTTRQAAAAPGRTAEDARAAAHLLDAYLRKLSLRSRTDGR